MGLNVTGYVEAFVRSKAPMPMRKKLKEIECRFGKKPNFVILSTGRAGSTYTSRLLSECGIKCSHETFFGPLGFCKSLRYDGDSSWLAVPYLEGNRSLCDIVLHQVRHPLDVISSLYGIRFFDPENSNPHIDFLRKYFHVTGNELVDCTRFWTEWNRRCESLSGSTYRFEDILSDSSVFLSEFGVDVARHKNRKNIIGMSREKINARKRNEVSFSDIPEGEVKDEMLNLSLRYGYDLG